ncbi:MAG: TIGR02594 family protein [Saprospiraceae bacterium]|nr:TIGR02594 family protein [Saprospiraceae bacterium]
MNSIIKIAAGEIGTKEIKGHEHNPRILEYQEMTGLDFGNDDIAWCSIFANWCALQAGLPQSHQSLARSWLKVGRKTSFPVPGDVVVLWRVSPDSWQGHVGFFMGFSHDGKSVFILGGNQNDEVNIRKYDIERVLQYRRLKPTSDLEVPVGYLRKGESNHNVKLLQLILVELEFLDDVADGVFGNNTEKALKKFQREHGITVDGIYGSESRGVLEEIL